MALLVHAGSWLFAASGKVTRGHESAAENVARLFGILYMHVLFVQSCTLVVQTKVKKVVISSDKLS